jgi:hypothetical protein
MSWFGTRELERRPRSFHAAALLQSVAGTLAFAAMVAAVQAVPASGLWFGPRWLAGGLMLFAFAETATGFHNFLTALLGLTVPGMLNSPVLSRSIGEFWTERWNPGASVFFRKACYEPLARHGRVRALFAAFPDRGGEGEVAVPSGFSAFQVVHSETRFKDVASVRGSGGGVNSAFIIVAGFQTRVRLTVHVQPTWKSADTTGLETCATKIFPNPLRRRCSL